MSSNSFVTRNLANVGFFSFWLKEQQAGQPLSWHLFLWKNCFSRFILMLLSISVSTGIVYAWQPFSAMLIAEGVYSWECTDEEIVNHTTLSESSASLYEPICSQQNNRIQALYTINMATEFIFGTAAGISLDYLGPLLTGVTGQVLLLLGVLSIALASSKCTQLYISAMIFLGGGCNFLTFPAIAMADYFPNHQGLIASLVIGCQNGSTIVTSIFDLIYRYNQPITLRTLFLEYLLFLLAPLGIFYILASPLIRPALNPNWISSNDKSNTSTTISAATLDQRPAESSDDQFVADDLPSHPEIHYTSIAPTPPLQPVVYSRTAKQDLMTVEMVLIGLFTLITVVQFNYYPTILRGIGRDDVARVNGYFLPTQGLWGVLYGVVVDRIGTLPVCHALMVMITLVYTFCLIPSHGLQYAATIIFILAGTYVYTVKFTFLQETFSPSNQGVLLGVLSLIGGLTLLINIPIHNLPDTTPVIIGLLVSVMICVSIILILQFRKAKGVTYVGVKMSK